MQLNLVYPEFETLSETILTNPKWQDKVEAIKTLEDFVSSSASLFKGKQEAMLLFILLFTKDFKVANMNILKSAFSLSSTLISVCGAGPKACKPIIESSVSKIHDKKLNSDLTALLSTICEKIGPSSVISQVLSLFLCSLDYTPHGEEQSTCSTERCSRLFHFCCSRIWRDSCRCKGPFILPHEFECRISCLFKLSVGSGKCQSGRKRNGHSFGVRNV